MSCPTCANELQMIVAYMGYVTDWCPTCGTVIVSVVGAEGTGTPHAPKLVERCREFEADMIRCLEPGSIGPSLPAWRTLGIAESIHPPGERK